MRKDKVIRCTVMNLKMKSAHKSGSEGTEWGTAYCKPLLHYNLSIVHIDVRLG